METIGRSTRVFGARVLLRVTTSTGTVTGGRDPLESGGRVRLTGCLVSGTSVSSMRGALVGGLVRRIFRAVVARLNGESTGRVVGAILALVVVVFGFLGPSISGVPSQIGSSHPFLQICKIFKFINVWRLELQNLLQCRISRKLEPCRGI